MKKQLLAIAILLSFLYSVVNLSAATFVDDFDDETFTNENWSPVFGDWSTEILSGSDLVYMGQNDAGSAANNRQKYNNRNLLINVDLTFKGTSNERNAGIFFSLNEDSLGQHGYAVFVKLNEDIAGLYLENFSDATDPYFIDSLLIPGLSEETLYSIEVATDSSGLISVFLYDDTGASIGSLLNNSPAPGLMDNGSIGVFAQENTVFNNFSLSGTPVPVPSTIWLLGSGIIGLCRIRRRKQ